MAGRVSKTIMTTVAKKFGATALTAAPAAAQAQAGAFAAARATADTIAEADDRAEALQEIATSQAKYGCAADALRTSALILLNRNEHLPAIAAAFAEIDDKEHFKRLLLPCAAHLDAAYKMCGHLARLYLEQPAGVAAVAQASGKHG
jgi:ATP-dependent exoDNAse (exonuclease V) beta subunit